MVETQDVVGSQDGVGVELLAMDYLAEVEADLLAMDYLGGAEADLLAVDYLGEVEVVVLVVVLAVVLVQEPLHLRWIRHNHLSR